MKKRVLIIGSGGREHALGWKLKKSKSVAKLYFAPGNAGTEGIGENIPIKATEIEKLLDFSLKNTIDLVVVGPDDPLAMGIVDEFKKHHIDIFGPTKKAAKLEWSKAFAKQFMIEENIPTATFRSFDNIEDAKTYAKTHPFPLVIKASGLALGKGVIIAKTYKMAEKILDDIMVKRIFGDAGREVVIEEFLKGNEISIHVLSDGKNYVIFPSSKDHKAIFDNDKGPNTGGMGTIAPVPFVDKKLMKIIEKNIVIPTLDGMKKRGMSFTGCLYPGLMITKDGPKVLEFNARFGDPETQSYMRLLKTDLFEIFRACVKGTLKKIKMRWENKSACCIVLASKGYPGAYEKGIPIQGRTLYSSYQKVLEVFHAGTTTKEGQMVINGGRVLGITAVGNNLGQALKRAYSAIGRKEIHFKGMQFRRDIGKKAMKSKNIFDF